MIISIILSNIQISVAKNIYQKFRPQEKVVAIVISDKTVHDYLDSYIVKDLNSNRFIIYVKKNINLQYGDKIEFSGEFTKANGRRNYKGFDYELYLKSKKIIGIYKNIKDIKVLQKDKINYVYRLTNKIRRTIIEKIELLSEKDTQEVLIGLLLGQTNNIDEETMENFKQSSMMHILAVSGMHLSYLIVGMSFLTKKIPKKINYILIILLIILFMFITNFTPSIVRAGIMAILGITSKIIYKKNDFLNSICFSLLILLVYNPYLIVNIGLILSFTATLGIALFSGKISEKIKGKLKFPKSLCNAIAVSISAQILILPIIMYNFNLISISFILSSLVCFLLVSIIIFSGFLTTIVSLISNNFAQKIVIIPDVLIKILMFSAKIIAKIKFLNYTIKTPKLVHILGYYILIFLIYHGKKIRNRSNQLKNENRIKKIVKKANKQNMWISVLSIIIAIILIFQMTYLIIPKTFTIYFIDVGQGDSTMIKTKKGKTILIDGGEENNVIFPYLLDRGITKLDYVLISHFDSDHVGGIFEIMEKIKLGTVVISKQAETSENYLRFQEIILRKRINVLVVNKGDRIKVDSDVYIDILWPDSSKFILENALNNNSIVCKLQCKQFSMLFTGDIEYAAEKEILEKYKNDLTCFNSDILKVAHHGSSTSSSLDFLKIVNAKIALIGVGENNKFNHPNEDVVERLKNLRNKDLQDG